MLPSSPLPSDASAIERIRGGAVSTTPLQQWMGSLDLQACHEGDSR